MRNIHSLVMMSQELNIHSLVGKNSKFGLSIDYELAPKQRIIDLKKNLPYEIDINSAVKIFKQDLFVNVNLELIENLDLYYLESNEGRGDELYYFCKDGKLFHGDKIWSRYHDFVPSLRWIKPSFVVEEKCWFVGTRNNYTHQVVDFLPNILYKHKLMGLKGIRDAKNVLGKKNPIIDSLSEIDCVDKLLNGRNLWLEQTGESVPIGRWNVRCIKFRNVYLVRHMSVYKAFELLGEVFRSSLPKYAHNRSAIKDVLYFARGDGRIKNQQEIMETIRAYKTSEVLSDMSKRTYQTKQNIISGYKKILMPPGSDNINGLCFANSSAIFYQMIAHSKSDFLSDPFLSYAGLRYLLPYLNRVFFVESESNTLKSNLHSGKWSIDNIRKILDNDI